MQAVASGLAETSETRGLFRLRHRLQVRFRDCDPMRHANNAVYYTYMEQGRFAYWQTVAKVAVTEERSFIIARTECDYRSPALPGELIDIWLRTASIGRSSFTIEYEMVSAADGRLIATARSVQVMYDYSANRPVPVPDDLAAKLEDFEGRTLSKA